MFQSLRTEKVKELLTVRRLIAVYPQQHLMLVMTMEQILMGIARQVRRIVI